jgi:hypothetical protein
MHKMYFHLSLLKTMLLNKQNMDVEYKDKEYVRNIRLLI